MRYWVKRVNAQLKFFRKIFCQLRLILSSPLLLLCDHVDVHLARSISDLQYLAQVDSIYVQVDSIYSVSGFKVTPIIPPGP